jgi:hypothetical protein
VAYSQQAFFGADGKMPMGHMEMEMPVGLGLQVEGMDVNAGYGGYMNGVAIQGM